LLPGIVYDKDDPKIKEQIGSEAGFERVGLPGLRGEEARFAP